MRLDPGSVIERLSAMPSRSPSNAYCAPLQFIPPGLPVPGCEGRCRASDGSRFKHKSLLEGNIRSGGIGANEALPSLGKYLL